MDITKITKNTKITISIGAIAGAMIVGWSFHEWLGTHMGRYFMTTVAAAELSKDVRKAAEAAQHAAEAAQMVAESLDSHIKGQDLKEQRQKLDLLKSRLQDIQLWESTNTPNAVSTATRRDLQNQIERTESYVECLEQVRPNCVP